MTDDKQMQLEKGIDRMHGRYDCKPKNGDCTVSVSQVYEDQKLHAIQFAKWVGEDHYLMEGEDIWINCCTGEKVGTTAELYELFLKEKKQ